ncbi:prephenate dehydrogenase [Myceligenerans salitolerans]|uniref:Prephenate dehydrogenase/arogenate dehydrogenase family protein n=1 Tax=Myceligenerans salitolerans TaxID=1230528 RepID=A0ABS3I8K1_9MICO|nr:prephenate dehydrogenase/arogenate dehydrogenase family protein [Myceligenerans salitolerans]MBO0608417.1 prephenate dehydrogenase/arogenate dehydrogenase family protein [Myceligenerans salitolerans]
MTSVGVVGLGLIGGSLARALVGAGVPVIATDPSDGARSAARSAGMQIADDVATLCGNRPETVVLAVPLRAMRAVAGEVAEALGREPGWDPTVVDVGSVKGPVREAIRDAGLAGHYVGAHPMAGTEHSGFDASFPDLLRGIRWAVTVDMTAEPAAVRPGNDGPVPVTVTDPDRLAGVLRLITAQLGGTAAVLTDDAHDEAAALVSHVPHVLAGELLGLVAGAPVRDVALGLAAGSFRDGTRVAYGDPRRTEAMVTQNAAWVGPALRLAARDLEMLADALDSNAPTGWFFDRPEPLRGRRAGHVPGRGANGVAEIPLRETDPPPEQRVPLEGDWPAVLVDRCAAGAVVVLMEPTTAVLT